MSQPQEIPVNKAHFLDGADQVRNTGPAWAQAIRAKSAARFAELEFPHRKMEEWRFTNITPILRTPFSPAAANVSQVTVEDIAPFRYDGKGAELVFVDGHFSESLSRMPGGITALGLANALTTHEVLIEPHLGHYLNGTSNAFAALNTTFLADGAFVHIEKDTASEAPIYLLFVNTKRDGTVAYPRNLIVLEPGAKADIVESHVCLEDGPKYFTNAISEVAVGENASLHLHKLIHESPEAYHLATTKVRVDRGGTFKSHAISQSGKIIRNEINVLLDGDGAHTSLHGLYMTSGDQLVDNPTSIEHAKPQCTSWIGYKGVLDDKSHAVFSGKVYVHRVAQKTDSNQLNQNLVLSDKATIDTKPLLEIFADDVKCTHGATVGRPPDELVFYFRTRGMSEAMALGMLTYGFADEVVNQIEIDAVRTRLERFVYNKYSPIPG
ncbi:MAG: Fe-S cluster assembly protein SufD [Candidatus Hydrogenedentes bacterium]|nr:Fe-S cluster assembly protein SufD [Candidatus Hydrogenedentota bacterium]